MIKAPSIRGRFKFQKIELDECNMPNDTNVVTEGTQEVTAAAADQTA